ncbi:MAG: ATP-dependent helicase [Clostridiales bacterium]|nr:ATP-dependent helicase [Clostridiales bacterium]
MMLLSEADLIQFYTAQYSQDAKRKRAASRASGYEKRANALRKTLKRVGVHQVSRGILEDYHRQIKNLLYIGTRYKNKNVAAMILQDMIPELVRLDLAMLLPDERSMLDTDFLAFLRQQKNGAICVKSLFELSQSYRRYCIENQMTRLVPSRPEMEFSKALEMNRHFILHVGPTNSGKTFEALSRLKDAGRGVYLGPLRLLALEVYEKMQEYHTPCTMLTGQECIETPGSRVTASTIEMADLGQYYDIAVIDEAQMVEDSQRGHSWTRAILGLLAEEIHICLSPAAEPAVTHLIKLCGDSCDIFRYERKVPLVCENVPFEFPESVLPGDALIVFSKKSVLDVAGRLEEQGISASVIYGSLPPEIRRRQVQMFANGQTKVVVATDAIGMGLNLPVRRIVFVQTEKFDGTLRRALKTQEIKQIAGRAGRYGLYETGYVTAMGSEELEYIRGNFKAFEAPIETVSLGFPQVLLDMNEPLDAILKVWHSVETPPPFVKVSIEDTLFLYDQASRRRDYIDGFNNKYLLYRMISCPIDVKDRAVVDLWLHYCECYTADISLPYPDKNRIGTSGIQKYETYYKELDLYYQFSVRLGKVIDGKWLARERARTESTIMRYLLGKKTNYISTCRYCGRKLPVGSPFGICVRCHEMERGHWKERRR